MTVNDLGASNISRCERAASDPVPAKWVPSWKRSQRTSATDAAVGAAAERCLPVRASSLPAVGSYGRPFSPTAGGRHSGAGQDLPIVQTLLAARGRARRVMLEPQGLEGPTFVLKEPINRVVKAATAQEAAMNRLYRMLGSDNFSAPDFTAVDTERNRLIMPDSIADVPPDVAQRVKTEFDALKKDCEIWKASNGPVIFDFERIQGPNLFDFSRGSYTTLDLAKKKQFFNDLGQIACLDLATGVLDRLIPARYEDNSYKLGVIDVNLENILCEEGTHRLYPIDNGIHLLAEEDDMQQAYLAFLTELLGQEDFTNTLANTIAEYYETAIDEGCNEHSTERRNRNEIRREFDIFMDNLKAFGIPNIAQGILAMRERLREQQDKVEQGLSTADQICPGIAGPLRERFQQLCQRGCE